MRETLWMTQMCILWTFITELYILMMAMLKVSLALDRIVSVSTGTEQKLCAAPFNFLSKTEMKCFCVLYI